MSFGWSAGDVIAGLKALYTIWEAVSDGPLNAKYEASQFFDEFYHVISRLDDWEKRKAACERDERLKRSHRELREDCTLFIKNHFSLIQQANPRTKAIRAGRSTWVQKVAFTRAQIVDLYRQVEWPTQRSAVTRLREKLRFFLELAAWDIALDTNRTVNDIRSTHSELIATNYRLVTSHLDLVQSITSNLKRVTNPIEPGRQTQEIDYPILRSFERLIEGNPSQNEITPWSSRRRNDEAQYASIASRRSEAGDGGVFGQEEVRGLISQRLDNLSMRVMRTETMETISESGSQDTTQPSIQHLLDRLKVIRAQIGDAVGVSNHAPPNETALVVTDPGTALKQELEAWDAMKERIEREILHPPPPVRPPPISSPAVRRVWTLDSAVGPEDTVPPMSTQTLPMAIQSRRNTGNLSPPASYNGWTGPTASSSRNSGSLSSSPNERRMSNSPRDRRLSSHSRSNSTSSIPRRPSIRSDHDFPIQLYYPQHSIRALIRSISRNDEGDVLSISSYSMDGLTRYRHTVDHGNEDFKIETSMTPFIDNHHVAEGYLDQTPRFRIQFKGMHNLKVLVRADNRGEVQIAAHPCPPMYKFFNEPDFLEFQSLLLNKEVKHHTDVNTIKSNSGQVICRVGTARILLDAFSRTRHILYFQHMNLPSDQKAGFMELPISHFKPPTEPGKRTKSLTLERQEGSKVSSPRGIGFGIARQGSVNTIASNETSAASAFARMGGRCRGLVIEFYDPAACHKFWEEFTKVEPLPRPFEQEDGLGLNFQSGFSVQLPGT